VTPRNPDDSLSYAVSQKKRQIMSESKRIVFTGKQKGEGRIRIGQGD